MKIHITNQMNCRCNTAKFATGLLVHSVQRYDAEFGSFLTKCSRMLENVWPAVLHRKQYADECGLLLQTQGQVDS
jgi:hypothetical protein